MAKGKKTEAGAATDTLLDAADVRKGFSARGRKIAEQLVEIVDRRIAPLDDDTYQSVLALVALALAERVDRRPKGDGR